MSGREGKKRICGGLVVFFLLAIAPQWTIAAAPSPLGVIQAGTERALQILRASHTGEAPSLHQRRSEILTVVDEFFNFDEMAKRALGRPWKDQPPEKRAEFVRLFKQLLFTAYINRVENCTGVDEQIHYDAERIDGEYAVVKTHVAFQGNQNVQIDYRLHQEGSQWKVYDVVVEGISFVSNYRSQFASILANESFDTLLRKMREKVGSRS